LVSWSRNAQPSFYSPLNCGRLPISLSLGFAAGGFPPAGTAGAAAAAPGLPGPPGPPDPPELGGPPGPPGALCMVFHRLSAILWDGVVVVVVVVAGSVPGRTVVVATVVVVVVVTILGVLFCRVC
jgi:hypothetical protein